MTETNTDDSIKKKFHIHGDTNSDSKQGGQEIRERKKSVNQPPPQETSPTSHGSGVKRTDFFYQIRLKFLAQPRYVQIGSIGAIIVVMMLVLFASRPPGGPSSPFIQRFANIVDDVFKEVHEIDLPHANTIMEHTVTCRRVANMVQNNVIFESHGTQITSGLRTFGEKIMVAGRSLRRMYSNGSSVYKSFDIEIEAMMQRLMSNYMLQGDTRYFKERLKSLLTKVQGFRKKVEEAQMAIRNAEEIRNDVERYIMEGLKSAEIFVKTKTEHVVDIGKAKVELDEVNKILFYLNRSAYHLDMMIKILDAYEDKLLDLSADLSRAGDDDDGFFLFTKKDLKFLQGSVKTLKFYHEGFNAKAQIPSS